MFGATGGEFGVLDKKAVTRMHGIAAAGVGHVQHTIGVEIALGHRRRADAHRFVGGPGVGRSLVGGGIDGHRPEPGRPAGADNPQGDLTAVGDKDTLHGKNFSDPVSAKAAAGGAKMKKLSIITIEPPKIPFQYSGTKTTLYVPLCKVKNFT